MTPQKRLVVLIVGQVTPFWMLNDATLNSVKVVISSSDS
jgi:hypothetical protein